MHTSYKAQPNTTPTSPISAPLSVLDTIPINNEFFHLSPIEFLFRLKYFYSRLSVEIVPEASIFTRDACHRVS
jgi:hypothetical protein